MGIEDPTRRDFIRLAAAAAGEAVLMPGAALAKTEKRRPEATTADLSDPKSIEKVLGKTKAVPWVVDFIQENGISITREPVEVLGHTISVITLEKRGPANPHIYVPHDNERAAFYTALSAIADGGRVVTFDSGGSRNLRTDDGLALLVDPNRIFREDSKYWPLAQKVLSKFKGMPRVFALHSNIAGGSFERTLRDSPTTRLHRNDTANKRNVVWISGNDEEINHASVIDRLEEARINCLYERVPSTGRLDGSLSQYWGRHGRSYYNLEVASDNTDERSVLDAARTQSRELAALFEAVGEIEDDSSRSHIASFE